MITVSHAIKSLAFQTAFPSFLCGAAPHEKRGPGTRDRDFTDLCGPRHVPLLYGHR